MDKRPECIGFIMDGNRRWATEKGLTPVEGHVHGKDVFEAAVRWLQTEQIPHGVFYAFSTENWRRHEDEVAGLLTLFKEVVETTRDKASADGVMVRIIGRREDFSTELQLDMAELEARSAQHAQGTTVWVALSYGGRAEILDAVNRAIAAGETVTEETFGALLYTDGMPDPDIIVRTSGEQRLSNFLPWQSVYSELHFIQKHWPALTDADFKDILTTYATRKRRHGH